MLKKLILSLLVALSIVTFSEFDTGRFIEELTYKIMQEPVPVKVPSGILSENGRAVPLGMTYDEVLSRFGDPMDVLVSEYGFSWNIFHENFQNYIQIGIAGHRVVGLYTNSPRFSFRGISVGCTRTDVNMILETPITSIVKGNTRYRMDNMNKEQINMELFCEDGMYITVFYDVFKNNSVTAIHIIEYETEQAYDRLYGAASPELQESFELQNFYVTNALRVREGLSALYYHHDAESVARLHSAEMAENIYFSHSDLSDGTVADRLKQGGIRYRTAGENIAMGAQNSLYMHELLMNSEGHRKNILADFKEVGMGVAFSAEDVPYLTQNFIG